MVRVAVNCSGNTSGGEAVHRRQHINKQIAANVSHTLFIVDPADTMAFQCIPVLAALVLYGPGP
jgi:hypothetical protein